MKARIELLLDQANQRLRELQKDKENLEVGRAKHLTAYRDYVIRLHNESSDRYHRQCLLDKANELDAWAKSTTADIATQQEYITKLLAQYNDMAKTEYKSQKLAASVAQSGMYGNKACHPEQSEGSPCETVQSEGGPSLRSG